MFSSSSAELMASPVTLPYYATVPAPLPTDAEIENAPDLSLEYDRTCVYRCRYR